jgi:superfamily I DNA/RNA helicase
MLMMKTNNLCVVGDWKQGIYGFRNANIENILNFREKIKNYKNILNRDYPRIKYDVNTQILDLDINYRSSQYILTSAEKSLTIKASTNEDLDLSVSSKIVHLKANYELDDLTDIEFLQADKGDEYDLIFAKIQDIVGRYKIKELKDDGYIIRNATYKDIAILSRRRDFCLELIKRAIKYGIPANYDGGVELFRTEPSILVLAWLRILLNPNDSKGWVPILEKEGYKFLEIQTIIDEKEYPF